MAIEIVPQALIEPVRPQTGGLGQGVEPARDATGANLRALGEGATDLGRSLTVMADRYQDQVDIAQSQHMRNLYDADIEKEMRGEGGFLSTEGMQATPERWKESQNRLRERRQAVEKLAQNKNQSANFAEFADRADSESVAAANMHTMREVRHYRAGEAKVAGERSVDRAIRFAGTEEGDIARAEAEKHYDDLANLLGFPKDSQQRKDLQQDALDKLHAGVIGNLLSLKAVPRAEEYLKQNQGEMSANVASKARQKIDEESRQARTEEIDAAAIKYANDLAGSGKPFSEQRADIDRRLRAGEIDGQVAMRTLSLAQGIDNQKYEALQRERREAGQSLEQAFASDPALDVDTLPAEHRATIDRLGMRGDAQRIHREVRQNRLADLMGEDEAISLRVQRDVRSNKEGEEFIGILEGKRDAIKRNADLMKTEAGREKVKRYEARIQETKDLLDALALRPRVFTMTPYNPASAGTPLIGPSPPAPQPIDMKKFAEDLRKSMYPSGGR